MAYIIKLIITIYPTTLELVFSEKNSVRNTLIGEKLGDINKTKTEILGIIRATNAQLMSL